MTQTTYTVSEQIKDQLNLLTIPTQHSNNCQCTEFGQCNSLTRECACSNGYSGTYCQHTTTELQSYKNRIESQFNYLQSNYNQYSYEDVVEQLNNLSVHSDAVLDSVALRMLTLLESLVSPTLTTTQLTASLEVLSNISEVAAHSEGTEVALASHIRRITSSIIENNLQSSSFSIESSKIVLKIETIDPSIQNTLSLGGSSNSQILLPSNFIPQGSSLQIAMILFKEPIYKSIASTDSISTSDTITLEVFENGFPKEITDLSQPFTLNFQVDSRNAIVAAQIQKVIEGTLSQDNLSCFFFDPALSGLSTKGCSLHSVTANQISCKCDHMTDFMTFLKTSVTTLEQSNYNVFEAISQLNVQNLKTNLGVYLAVGYWGTFCLLLCICGIIDYSKLRHNFYQKIKTCSDKGKSKGQSNNKENNTKRKYYEPRYKRQIPLTRKKKYGSATELNESVANTSVTISPPDLTQEVICEQQDPSFEKKKRTKKGASQIKERVESVIREKRCCCCTFLKLMKNQLSENNQIYNLVTKTSPLNRRSIRLQICYFALLLELSLCALFFNLGPSPSGPLFWDQIIQNFWVAVFSILFSLVPLLVLGLILSPSRSQTKSLRLAEQMDNLKQVYQKLKPKLKCKARLASFFFFVFSNFLLLFLVCFCHVANPQSSENWVQSSFLSILTDQLAFELAPAIVVGFLGILSGCCGRCSCPMWGIIWIELYRLYKNLVTG